MGNRIQIGTSRSTNNFIDDACNLWYYFCIRENIVLTTRNSKKRVKPTLAWLDRCPECSALLFFNLREVSSRSWLWFLDPVVWQKLLLAKTSRELSCGRCGLTFEYDVARFRRLGAWWAVAWGIAIFVGILIMVRFSLPSFWIWFFLFIPISLALLCQMKIKCLSVIAAHDNDEIMSADQTPHR
jgi:hypothetical protein